jgi:hypothetical protein
MGESTKSVTTLTVPVPEQKRTITAVIEPALEPEQQKAVDEAARQAHALSEVVRVLITQTAQHGRSVRSIAVEDVVDSRQPSRTTQ